MGQKINPNGFRVGINKDWGSRWFVPVKEFPKLLKSDCILRSFIKDKIKSTGVSKIDIERRNDKVFVFIHCAKPGIVIGRAGSGIEKLKTECESLTKSPVIISVLEVKKPDSNAQLIAESVSLQLEKRVSYRRAVKQAISKAIKAGIKGVKINVAGRLGGAEIARAEHYHEGSIPLQTIRADIDYGFSEANTTYGKIGVKVWTYKGEIFKKTTNNPVNKGGASNAVA